LLGYDSLAMRYQLLTWLLLDIRKRLLLLRLV